MAERKEYRKEYQSNARDEQKEAKGTITDAEIGDETESSTDLIAEPTPTKAEGEDYTEKRQEAKR